MLDRACLPHPTIAQGATFDPSEQYRYCLWRRWDASAQTVTFVMLNPSTADGERDDPTIRRCIGFAQTWGYGTLYVVNLFAYRATHPRDLFRAADPVGPDNDRHLRATVQHTDRLIVAWGNRGTWGGQHRAFLAMLAAVGRSPDCLGLTQQGQPRHPLYQRRTCRPQPFTPAPSP